MRVITGSEMKKIDLWAQEQRRIPPLLLMENAGRAVADVVQELYPGREKESFVFLVGKGNNGGDALVAARHLYQQGIEIQVFFLFPQDTWSGLVRQNWQLLKDLGVQGHYLADEHSFYLFKLCLSKCTLLLDGILGTGLRQKLPTNLVKTIELVNNCSVPVVAIDLPTGVNADNGQIGESCLRAEQTITLAWAKRGLLLYPAKEYVGQLIVVDISLPQAGLALVDLEQYYVESQLARCFLPERSPLGHKNIFGHVLVMAGSAGMMGAAYLAGKAVLRSGAGQVTVGVPFSLAAGFNLALPEAITLALAETAEGTLSSESEVLLSKNLLGKKALVFGPGLGTGKQIGPLLQKVLKEGLPLVLDADGLNVLAREPALKKGSKAPLVLTPHPGEMARLLETTVKAVQKNRVAMLLQAVEKFEAVVVLKGAVTLIATPAKELFINSTGCSALATAGSGDVLAGLIGGLLAQGLSAKKAAVLGVYLHGLAGEIAAGEKGEHGVIAGDVLEALPLAFKKLV